MASGSPQTLRPLGDLHLLSRSGFLIRRRHDELRGFGGVEPGLITQNPVSATSLQTRRQSWTLRVCLSTQRMFTLPSAPSFCPLPRFHPLHLPYSLCPIFLLLVFEPSSFPPHLSLLYLSSHYFSVLFHFLFSSWSLVGLALLFDDFSCFCFPVQPIHGTTLVHLLWQRSVCGVCVYLPHSGWLAWRALALADHRASSACCSSHFPGGDRQTMKQKARNDRVFICQRCWRCSLRQSQQRRWDRSCCRPEGNPAARPGAFQNIRLTYV